MPTIAPDRITRGAKDMRRLLNKNKIKRAGIAPANMAVPAQAPVRPALSNVRTGIHQRPQNNAEPKANQSGRFVLFGT